MNWNTKELNNISDLEYFKGKMAFDKFGDEVKIIDAFRNPNRLSTATIAKTDKNGRLKVIDVPLCALRIKSDNEPDYSYREDQCARCKTSENCKFRESYCNGSSECPIRYDP